MKTRKLSFAILAIAIVAIAVVIVSCKKEKQEPTTNNTEQSVQSVENMDEYLILFKKKLLSTKKGGETIGLEQAQRDLSNLLNYDFGDVNYATNVFEDDTLYAKLEFHDGQIYLFELANTYNTAKELVWNAFKENNVPEKSIYSIVCNITEHNAKDAESENVEIIVTIRGYTGESMMPNSSEGWRPSYRGGTCDGQLVGAWGGARIVETWLNNYVTLHFPSCVGRGYFTDISYSNKRGFDPEMYIPYQNQNPYYNYRLYVTNLQNPDDDCLSVEDLQFYYNEALNLHNVPGINFNPPFPSDHTPMQYYLSLIPYGYGINNNPVTPWMWHLQIKHGKFNCSEDPELPIIFD